MGRGLALLIILFLTSCGPKPQVRNVSQNLNDPNPHQEPDYVCYPGDELKSPLCMELVNVDATDLGYRNPHTDPSFPYKNDEELLKYWYSQPINVAYLYEQQQSQKLLPNFKVWELMSLQKDEFGIYSRQTAQTLQNLRDASGGALRVTSGFRSPSYNDDIPGAAEWSRHQYGDAFDIQPLNDQSLEDLKSLCEMQGAYFTQLYTTHVHCDWRAQTLDQLFYGIINIPVSLQSMFANNLKGETLNSYAQNSTIVTQGRVEWGGAVFLSTQVTLQEDAGTLLHRWQINLPTGQVLKYEKSKISLPLDFKGEYKVHLNLGGNVELEKVLKVQ